MSFTVILRNGKQVPIRLEAPLLRTLAPHGYYSECRQGFCGACRVTLTSGQVHYLQTPLAQIKENEILPCCCVAQSDLVLGD
ncbi:MAG: class I ribonucleotide reductase maintenance protein YfaE [Ferrimonas sp.]